MMDIETRRSETKRFFTEISLDDIRVKSNDPDWWYATRAMCAFALVVAEQIGAEYIFLVQVFIVHTQNLGDVSVPLNQITNLAAELVTFFGRFLVIPVCNRL